MSHRILCADPDDRSRGDTVETLREELGDLDPTFETAGTVADAESLLSADIDVLVTEYMFPDGTGLDLIAAARETCPDAGCVLHTDTDPDTIDTTQLQGTVIEYVGKGSVFGTERLAQLLRTTIERNSQRSYPVPQTETERLEALKSYDLDDETLVSSLDRITEIAAMHFDVDQSSINLIEEHSQEFLACYGGTKDWDSMDREDSICTFTILEDEHVMTVEDVTEDPRFQSRSDTLLELGIRAYIGANLVTATGLVIGALCVYDDDPRSFSATDERFLRELATVAMDLIELHSQRESPTTDGGHR